MPDPSRMFTRALSGVWGNGYWVTWHPSARYRLGDVGTLRGPGLVLISSLDEIGIATSKVTPTTRDELTWRTRGRVSVTYKSVGQTGDSFAMLADAQAGALVEFSRENALLVAYRGLSEHRLADQPVLARELIRRYWAGTWELDWHVISHLVTAKSGTVLLAGEKGALVEMHVRAALGEAPAALADLAAGVRGARSSGMELELLGKQVTPFYRVLRLRRRFIRGIEGVYGDVRTLRTSANRPPDVPADVLEEIRESPDVALEFPDQPTPASCDETA
ncbi:hypothetical protein [Streptomyces cinnamoneus]|uniref:Uncharacterized protein n=1 Tax=Streptomyces cinnamoneus TaxID=53446 RepID=A0A918TET6_STRCJ|nr:hypothetical protein [Streptomyces cinnamoneus]GHC45034.1 hypothetical protein GCM10010507_20220 [Streptomyces cinnamoneus]